MPTVSTISQITNHTHKLYILSLNWHQQQTNWLISHLNIDPEYMTDWQRQIAQFQINTQRTLTNHSKSDNEWTVLGSSVNQQYLSVQLSYNKV